MTAPEHATEIKETLDLLEVVHTPAAEQIARELWDELADIELGAHWHEVGPDGALIAARELLAQQPLQRASA